VNTFEEDLLQDGIVSPERLEQAREAVHRSGRALVDVLVEQGLADEASVLRALARRQGLEFVDLKETTVDDDAVRAVGAKLAAHYGIMPLRLDATVLKVAAARITDTAAVEDIETHTGRRVELMLACRADIRESLRRHYGVGAETVERILADAPQAVETLAVEESQDIEKAAEDASVVRLVNQLLQEAIQARATDLHLEVYRQKVTVRRRVDGVLYDARLPQNIRALYPAMVSRIKLMSGLNIVERRLPQDGRSRVRVGNQDFDLRVSVVPSIYGEDIVVRVLPATMLFNLEDLGFSGENLAALKDLIAQPHGIIFVTGPTGSGKSTTLYACLSRLNTRDRKIITIEDPVEYELQGITQTQVCATARRPRSRCRRP